MTTQQSNALLQPMVENLIKDLGEKAESFGKTQHPQLYNLINNCCDKSILTCGAPSSYKKRKENIIIPVEINNSKQSWIGFCCSKHVDTCDNVSKGIISDLYKKNCLTTYMKEFVERVGCGLPTSCQYFHVWKDKNISQFMEVQSYFLYHGLGIATPIRDSLGITFLGFGFAHSTSATYIVDLRTNTFIFKNNPDIMSILAWGRSGGHKEYKRMIERNI